MITMLLLGLTTAVESRPDHAHAVNLTVYHEYPPQFESLGLVNQDTGDLQGDAFFVLRGFLLPIECKSHDPEAHNDCNNPEQNASNINVVSEHLVRVDSRFGPYGRCNEASGQYSCDCGTYSRRMRCGAPVGRAEVSTRYDHREPPTGSPAWKFWRVNLARKTGGYWYSTHKVGECHSEGVRREGDEWREGVGEDAPRSCTWQVIRNERRITSCVRLPPMAALLGAPKGIGDFYFPPLPYPHAPMAMHPRTVRGACQAAEHKEILAFSVHTHAFALHRRCLLNRVAKSVVDYNASCFAGCAQPTNASAPCWVECLMETLLGPQGGARLTGANEGMPIARVADSWRSAFAPASAGGCADAYRPDGLLRRDEPTLQEAIAQALPYMSYRAA